MKELLRETRFVKTLHKFLEEEQDVKRKKRVSSQTDAMNLLASVQEHMYYNMYKTDTWLRRMKGRSILSTSYPKILFIVSEEVAKKSESFYFRFESVMKKGSLTWI